MLPGPAIVTVIQTIANLLRMRMKGEARTVVVVDPARLSPAAVEALKVLVLEAVYVKRLEAEEAERSLFARFLI